MDSDTWSQLLVVLAESTLLEVRKVLLTTSLRAGLTDANFSGKCCTKVEQKKEHESGNGAKREINKHEETRDESAPAIKSAGEGHSSHLQRAI